MNAPLTKEQIARLLGPQKEPRKLAKNLGAARPRIPQTKKDQLRMFYKKHPTYTIREIASRFNISEGATWKIINKGPV